MREAVFLLALASANSGISMRVIEPMLPRLATDFGTSISGAASVITAYALGAAIGTLAYGPLGDRFGKLRMATISLLGAGLASLACAFASGPTGQSFGCCDLPSWARLPHNIPTASERNPRLA